MAEQVVHSTQQSSCEITTTAKGDALVTVKVYSDNADGAASLAVLLYNRTALGVAKKTDALTGEVLVRKPPAIIPSSSSA